jgi:hypothetical protein
MFYILLSLSIIEQFFYLYPKAYPYEYGLLFKSIKLGSTSKQLFEKKNVKVDKGLLIKRTLKNDIYLRYKYPKIFGGPFLFAGHIKNETNILKIRIGYFSLLFLIYLLFVSFFPIGLNTIAVILCIICIIYFSYIRFKRKIDLLIED